MEKIPEYILEAVACGEKNAFDYYEKYGKDEFEKALSELKKSDEAILSELNSEKIYNSVKNRISSKNIYEGRKNQKRKMYLPVKAFVPVAVAAALVVMILPGVLRAGKNISFSEKTEEMVRVKGGSGSKLFLYQQTEEKISFLKNNTKLREGDLIQVAFNPYGKKYALIFSIDGNHKVTGHFGSENLDAYVAESKMNYLDFSYELDNAPDYEVFIMITSDSPFNFGEQAEELRGKKLNQIKNRKFIKNYIDKDAEVSTFVLLK